MKLCVLCVSLLSLRHHHHYSNTASLSNPPTSEKDSRQETFPKDRKKKILYKMASLDLDKCLSNLKEGKILKERELKNLCSMVCSSSIRCFCSPNFRQSIALAPNRSSSSSFFLANFSISDLTTSI